MACKMIINNWNTVDAIESFALHTKWALRDLDLHMAFEWSLSESCLLIILIDWHMINTVLKCLNKVLLSYIKYMFWLTLNFPKWPWQIPYKILVLKIKNLSNIVEVTFLYARRKTGRIMLWRCASVCLWSFTVFRTFFRSSLQL
jgi:hypothetical protein